MDNDLLLINGNRDLVVVDFRLPAGEYTLGRSSDCELPINDPTISRVHARLVVADSKIQVTDLGSRNGTFLQGKAVQSGVATVGQVLRFGRVIFTVDELGRYLPSTDESQTADFRPGQSLAPTPAPHSHVGALLTPSQLRVLACMLEGMTEKEAGVKLGISRHTVHNHIRDIYQLLGVRSRGELLSKFISADLGSIIGPPPPHQPRSLGNRDTHSELDVHDAD
jgi:DNA-binding CsgD family transcriptional regulator